VQKGASRWLAALTFASIESADAPTKSFDELFLRVREKAPRVRAIGLFLPLPGGHVESTAAPTSEVKWLVSQSFDPRVFALSSFHHLQDVGSASVLGDLDFLDSFLCLFGVAYCFLFGFLASGEKQVSHVNSVSATTHGLFALTRLATLRGNTTSSNSCVQLREAAKFREVCFLLGHLLRLESHSLGDSKILGLLNLGNSFHLR
jgi:hypothetical protein